MKKKFIGILSKALCLSMLLNLPGFDTVFSATKDSVYKGASDLFSILEKDKLSVKLNSDNKTVEISRNNPSDYSVSVDYAVYDGTGEVSSVEVTGKSETNKRVGTITFDENEKGSKTVKVNFKEEDKEHYNGSLSAYVKLLNCSKTSVDNDIIKIKSEENKIQNNIIWNNGKKDFFPKELIDNSTKWKLEGNVYGGGTHINGQGGSIATFTTDIITPYSGLLELIEKGDIEAVYGGKLYKEGQSQGSATFGVKLLSGNNVIKEDNPRIYGPGSIGADVEYRARLPENHTELSLQWILNRTSSVDDIGLKLEDVVKPSIKSLKLKNIIESDGRVMEFREGDTVPIIAEFDELIDPNGGEGELSLTINDEKIKCDTKNTVSKKAVFLYKVKKGDTSIEITKAEGGSDLANNIVKDIEPSIFDMIGVEINTKPIIEKVTASKTSIENNKGQNKIKISIEGKNIKNKKLKCSIDEGKELIPFVDLESENENLEVAEAEVDIPINYTTEDKAYTAMVYAKKYSSDIEGEDNPYIGMFDARTDIVAKRRVPVDEVIAKKLPTYIDKGDNPGYKIYLGDDDVR